jgi:hypothetical protein
MPRHPPCALTHFNHNKMLASTMQHSTHNHTPTITDPTTPTQGTLEVQVRSSPAEKTPPGVFSGPNSVPNFNFQLFCDGSCSTQLHPIRAPTEAVRDPEDTESEIRTTTTYRAVVVCLTNTVRLLRKEVIQPHLPVRLPCYDFVPIASPTFDNSLPQAG